VATVLASGYTGPLYTDPSLAAYQAAGLSRVSMKLYQDARHELVNETNRDAVIAELITWLDEAVRA